MTYPNLHPEDWLILPEEEPLLANRTAHGRFGFAVLLKFFQAKGRFPSHKAEVNQEILAKIAEQIGTPIEAWHDLLVEPEKTKVISFSRFRKWEKSSFELPGFELRWGLYHNGRDMVIRRTAPKKHFNVPRPRIREQLFYQPAVSSVQR